MQEKNPKTKSFQLTKNVTSKSLKNFTTLVKKIISDNKYYDFQHGNTYYNLFHFR